MVIFRPNALLDYFHSKFLIDLETFGERYTVVKYNPVASHLALAICAALPITTLFCHHSIE